MVVVEQRDDRAREQVDDERDRALVQWLPLRLRALLHLVDDVSRERHPLMVAEPEVGGAVGLGDLIESALVQVLHVVVLHVSLEGELPVRFRLVHPPVGEMPALHLPSGEIGPEIAEKGVDIDRIGPLQPDPNHPVSLDCRHRHQSPVLAAEVVEGLTSPRHPAQHTIAGV